MYASKDILGFRLASENPGRAVVVDSNGGAVSKLLLIEMSIFLQTSFAGQGRGYAVTKALLGVDGGPCGHLPATKTILPFQNLHLPLVQSLQSWGWSM